MRWRARASGSSPSLFKHFMMRVNRTQLSTALEIPMSYAYAAIPAGAALMLCVLAYRVFETVTRASRSRRQEGHA